MDNRQYAGPSLPPGWQPYAAQYPPQVRVFLSIRHARTGCTVMHGMLPVPQTLAALSDGELCRRMLLSDVGAVDRIHHEVIAGRVFLWRAYLPAAPTRPVQLRCARRVGGVLEVLLVAARTEADGFAALHALQGTLRLLPGDANGFDRRSSTPSSPPARQTAPRPMIQDSRACNVPMHSQNAAPVHPIPQPKTKKRASHVGATLLKVALVLLLAIPLLYVAKTEIDKRGGLAVVFGTEQQRTEIENQTQLCAYLNERFAAGEDNISFYYTGSDNQTITNTLVNYMTNALSSTLDYDTKERRSFSVTLLRYPSEQILNAWRTKDESALSADEKKVLRKAESILADAKAASGSQMELEIALHDAICKRVSYLTGKDDVEPAQPQRYMTVVGALLDGKANCQGYSDAFYLLATMAGFEVGRQSATSNDDVGHRFNTIHLDGKWYVVDVTYDDAVTKSGSDFPCYMLFNAGSKMCTDYSWDAAAEPHPIEKKCDSHYYYDYQPTGVSALHYQKSFSNLDDLAVNVLREWRENGRTAQCVMLSNAEADPSAMNACIKKHAASYRMSMQWSTCVQGNGRDAFYYIVFE